MFQDDLEGEGVAEADNLPGGPSLAINQASLAGRGWDIAHPRSVDPWS